MVVVSDNTLRITLEREVDDSYDVAFGCDMFPQIAKDLEVLKLGSRYAIVTDSNVARLYGGRLKAALDAAGIQNDTFCFEAGEESKTIDTCMRIMGSMSKSRFGRDSAIIALGGGVTGDMAGFMAAIFNRGIPYVQIPTTLLAMADSAIGGKTAVDTEYGKNLVGAFKQPAKVYVDVATLETLTDRDYATGLAETVKHGVIQAADFFEYLRQNAQLILKRDRDSLLRIAKRNCEIKGKVVEQDPNEKGIRRILNYGHTAGHAIELLSGFKLTHGEAVAIGMMVAGRIAVDQGYFPQSSLEQQGQLLRAFGLPTTIPASISDEQILNVALLDKKAAAGSTRYVLPVSIGSMNDFGGAYAAPVEKEVVMCALRMTR